MLAHDAFQLSLGLWPFLTQGFQFVLSNLVCCYRASEYMLFTPAHVCLHFPDARHRRAPRLVLKTVQHITISSAKNCNSHISGFMA